MFILEKRGYVAGRHNLLIHLDISSDNMSYVVSAKEVLPIKQILVV